MSAMYFKPTPPISEPPFTDSDLAHITQWVCQKFQWSINTTEELEVPSAYEQWIAQAIVWKVDNVEFPIWVIESFSKDLEREVAILEHWALQYPYALVIWNSRGKKIWKLGWMEYTNCQILRCSIMMGLNQLEDVTLGLIDELTQIPTSREHFREFFRPDRVRPHFIQPYLQWKRWTLQKMHASIPHSDIVGKATITPDKVALQRNQLFLQVVGIYFLQLRGWLGVGTHAPWGSGNRRFLQQEWQQIQQSQSNFWLYTLRPILKSIYDGTSTPTHLGQIQLPHLDVPFFSTELLYPHSLDNDIFWHPKHGLLTILAKTPLYLGRQPDFNQYIAINESILGTILEESLEREDGNKTESYYTHPAVAKELCRLNIENYLVTHLTKLSIPASSLRVDVSQWINGQDLSPILTPHRSDIINLLSTIRICDPAVGVGALLVAMLDLLTTLHKQLTPEKDRATIKYEVLSQSLFGVDIDANALLVATMRLWCAWIQDCPAPRAFVNLERSLVEGNSLSNNPFGLGDINPIILAPGSQPHDLEHPMSQNIFELRKGLLHLFERYPLVPATQAHEALKVLRGYGLKLTLLTRHTPLPIEQAQQLIQHPEQFCIWPWTFLPIFCRENPGFDIVLCNPPFLNGTDEITILKDTFASNFDIPVSRETAGYLFLDLALQLTRQGGSCGFLMDHTIQFSRHAQPVRTILHDQCHMTHLLSLHAPVLQDSTHQSQALILCYTRENQLTDQTTLLFLDNNLAAQWGPLTRRYQVPTSQVFLGASHHIQVLDWQRWQPVLNILADSQTLRQIVQPNQGLVTGLNRKNNRDHEADDYPIQGVFVLEDSPSISAEQELIQHLRSECPELLKPFARSRSINHFTIEKTNQYVLYIGKNTAISPADHPILWQHLLHNKTDLSKRQGLDSEETWWKLSWPRSPQIFSKDAIVCPARTNKNERPAFTLNHLGYFYASDCTLFTKNEGVTMSMAYIVGLLNSSLVYWWLLIQQLSIGQNGHLEISPSKLQALPIPNLSQKAQDAIAELVKESQDHLSLDPDANKAHEVLEQIDQIIYADLNLPPSSVTEINRVIQQHSGT